VGAVILALAVLFGAVRPVLKAMQKPETPKPLLDAVLEEPLALPEPEEIKMGPRTEEKYLEAARQLARENPAAVAGIVKNWIGANKDDSLSLLPQNPNTMVS
jgi:flagellar M-ring protein FliF